MQWNSFPPVWNHSIFLSSNFLFFFSVLVLPTGIYEGYTENNASYFIILALLSEQIMNMVLILYILCILLGFFAG